MAAGGETTATAAGAQAPARTGAAAGGVTAGAGAAGTVSAGPAQEAPGVAKGAEAGGVTAITVANTGDIATAGGRATPDINPPDQVQNYRYQS